MNRKWCAARAVWIAPPTPDPTTILGRTGPYDGLIRAPGGGRLLSGALVRTVIHPDPGLSGSTNGPVNVAPASSVITSPGRALWSAARKLPPADTAIVCPEGATRVVSTNCSGLSGKIAGEPGAPLTTPVSSAATTAAAATGTGNCRSTPTIHPRDLDSL